MAQHDLLFDVTHLGTWRIGGVATLLDAVARQVAAGAARITHNHAEVARLIAIHADGSPRLWVIGHVVLRIAGRTVGLGVGIDTEYAVVASLTGPHPVVGLATIFTHRLGNGEHQTHIVEVAIGGHVVLVALIEWLHFDTQGRVLRADVLLPDILDGIDEFCNILQLQLVHTQLVQLVGNVLLFYHETDKQIVIGQFLLKALGIETIQQVVVLHGGVLADSIEAAVMVGEHETIGRYDDA